MPEPMTTMDSWITRQNERHQQEVLDGQHDDQCEWGHRLMRDQRGEVGPGRIFMCHCAKRRREAAGHTTPPGPLEHRLPLCPRCWREVDFGGDGFECETCRVYWSSDDPNDEGTFTDDYGDLGQPLPGGSGG